MRKSTLSVIESVITSSRSFKIRIKGGYAIWCGHDQWDHRKQMSFDTWISKGEDRLQITLWGRSLREMLGEVLLRLSGLNYEPNGLDEFASWCAADEIGSILWGIDHKLENGRELSSWQEGSVCQFYRIECPGPYYYKPKLPWSGYLIDPFAPPKRLAYGCPAGEKALACDR